MRKNFYLFISLFLFFQSCSYAELWESIPVKNDINIFDIDFLDYANCDLIDEEELSCEMINQIITEEKSKPNVVTANCESYPPGEGYQCDTNFKHIALSRILRQAGMKKVNFAVALECSGIKKYEFCTWTIFGEK